jgi:hypothetical protein
MDTAVKVRQWWIEHDVNRSLSYYLDATLLREAGEIKLQEMPEICTTNSRYNSKEKKNFSCSTVGREHAQNLPSDGMMTCRQKLLFVMCDKQMK